jgi:hypothetical protein
MATQQAAHQVGITPRALKAMEESGQEWDFFFEMHLCGICSEEDRRHNREGATQLEPLVTAYRTLKGRDLLVITDKGRSLTTILVPEERSALSAS